MDPFAIRKRMEMNQTEFWEKLGVNQPTGSRYEAGRQMPSQVEELLRLVYVEGVDLQKVDGIDFEIVALLKKEQPDLYRTLRTEVSRRRKSVIKVD